MMNLPHSLKTGTSGDRSFRVGIVVDSNVRDPFIADFISTMIGRPDRDVLVIRRAPAATDPMIRRTVARIGHRLETKILRTDPQCALPAAAELILDCGDTAAALAAQHVDLLVNLSASALDGDLVDVARYGVLTCSADFATGDRPAAAGFREACSREELTRFSISHASSSRDAPRTLVDASFGTNWLASVNTAEVRKQSLFHLTGIINRVAASQPLAHGNLATRTAKAEIPRLGEQARYAVSVGQVIADKILRRLQKKRSNWSVGYVYGDWRSDRSRCQIIRAPADRFLADPFVISRNNREYVFVEDWSWLDRRGTISAFEISADGPQELGKALVEPFHLSFPYLLEIEGLVYMLPETSEAGEIRLYECVDFPLRWRLKTVLMSGISAADTMMFRRNGLWWILTNIDRQGTGNHGSEFSIFFSESPFSNSWTPHAKNPISHDATSGRNGGLVGDWDGQLYRVVQVPGFNTYGRRTQVFEIEELTPTSYREKLVHKIDPDFLPGLTATHHLHSNGRVTVFDFIQD